MNQSPGFEILAELGRGTTGIVYKARETKLNRLVALTVCSADPHGDETRRSERAVHVAKLLASLGRDWDIPPIHAVWEDQGHTLSVREFVDGATLEQACSARLLDLRGGLGILASVARTVQRLHERGIVHRNLHPANILLPHEARPQLIGFGMIGLVGSSSDVPAHMAGASPKVDVLALKRMVNWLGEALEEPLPAILDDLRQPGTVVTAGTFADTLSRAAARPDSSRPWWRFWL